MEAETRALAAASWDAREDFRFGPVTTSVEECIALAAASSTRPVILADSGDNPTGGGVGDRGDVLAVFLDRGRGSALFAGIADRPATEAAYRAGIGQRLWLSIGATLDPAGVSVETEVEVLALLDADKPEMREAVVRTGQATIILTARRRPFHDIGDFTRFGFRPEDFDLVVVKSGYLSPDLAPIANPNLMALSEGVVDQDIPRIANLRRSRPMFPFDRDFAYQPAVIPSIRAR